MSLFCATAFGAFASAEAFRRAARWRLGRLSPGRFLQLITRFCGQHGTAASPPNSSGLAVMQPQKKDRKNGCIVVVRRGHLRHRRGIFARRNAATRGFGMRRPRRPRRRRPSRGSACRVSDAQRPRAGVATRRPGAARTHRRGCTFCAMCCRNTFSKFVYLTRQWFNQIFCHTLCFPSSAIFITFMVSCKLVFSSRAR